MNTRKNLYLFSFSFLLFIVSATIQFTIYSRMQKYTEEVENSRHTINLLERISNHFKSVQIYSKAYHERTKNNYYAHLLKEAELLSVELKRLGIALQNDTLHARSYREVEKLITENLPILMSINIAEIIDSGQGHKLGTLYRISYHLGKMVVDEEKELSNRRLELNQSINSMNIISMILVGLAAVIIIGVFVNNLFLTRKGQWLEGFLESVINTSQNGILSCKPIRRKGEIEDFEVEFTNTAFEKLFGLKSVDVVGKRLSAIVDNTFNRNLVTEFADVVKNMKATSFEVHYQTGDISRWFYVLVARRSDGITASFNDITEIKKYQNELEASVQELARSNADLEQYAYAASHDLQEPLRKIRTFSTFLLDKQAERLDEKGRDNLNKIINSTERMTMLIRDILNFSALNKEAQFVEADLHSVIRNILQDLDLIISQKKARIEIGDLPVIEAIPLQMSQLFYNLLSNSLKFTDERRQPKITITGRQLTKDEINEQPKLNAVLEYFEIIVEDNGIGFSQDQAENIFGLFKRLHGRQTYGGSGIGLALCLRVVENHKGLIYASGEPGAGAKFTIILPSKHQNATL